MNPASSRSWRGDHWTWRYLSLLVARDVDEAFRIVGRMSEQEQLNLLGTALISQSLALRDVPEAKDWHERSAAAWGHVLVLKLLGPAGRTDGVTDDGQAPW